MRSFRSTALQLVLVVVLVGGAMAFQNRLILRFYSTPDKFHDSLYVPSRSYLHLVSVGYDQFLADFFWLRMIQTFAATGNESWKSPETAEQMMSYFNGITDLDPKFLEVYSFALGAMGESAKRPDLVKQIVTKSFGEVPGNWKVPEEGAAFFGLPDLKDADAAKVYTRLALLSPDHPSYLENWLGFFEVKEGLYRAAYEKYMTDYIQSVESGDETMQDFRLNHLRRDVNEWIKSPIIKAAEKWYDRTQQVPTIEELMNSGAFADLELPNWASITAFLNTLKAAGDQAPEMTGDQIRGFIGRFIERWHNQIPPGPDDLLLPSHVGYVIFRDPSDRNRKYPFEVISKRVLIQRYQFIMQRYQARIDAWKSAHGGACPETVGDVLPDMKGLEDPLGGQFEIDPKTCALTVTSLPDLMKIQVPPL